MSALLWIDTDADEAVDLGDPFRLYGIFSEMQRVAGGVEGFEELFGVVEATEIQDDVDKEWLVTVKQQARDFFMKHARDLSDDALHVLKELAKAGEASRA